MHVPAKVIALTASWTTGWQKCLCCSKWELLFSVVLRICNTVLRVIRIKRRVVSDLKWEHC